MVITSSVINIQVCVITNIYMVLIRRRQWHPTPVLLPRKPHGRRSLVGCSPWGRWNRTWLSNFTFTFHFHALEKEMATHSGVLAWRIPGTGKPDGLPSMGSHRVGHDWSDLAAAAGAHYYVPGFVYINSLNYHCIPILQLRIWGTERVKNNIKDHMGK